MDSCHRKWTERSSTENGPGEVVIENGQDEAIIENGPEEDKENGPKK